MVKIGNLDTVTFIKTDRKTQIVSCKSQTSDLGKPGMSLILSYPLLGKSHRCRDPCHHTCRSAHRRISSFYEESHHPYSHTAEPRVENNNNDPSCPHICSASLGFYASSPGSPWAASCGTARSSEGFRSNIQVVPLMQFIWSFRFYCGAPHYCVRTNTPVQQRAFISLPE